MEMGTVDIKEHLLQSDEDFKRLAQKHHQYDEQLDKLIHKIHLSEEEKVEEVTLKKKKLQQSMLEKSQAQLQNLITMVCLCTTLIACCVTIFLHFVRAD